MLAEIISCPSELSVATVWVTLTLFWSRSDDTGSFVQLCAQNAWEMNTKEEGTVILIGSQGESGGYDTPTECRP